MTVAGALPAHYQHPINTSPSPCFTPSSPAATARHRLRPPNQQNKTVERALRNLRERIHSDAAPSAKALAARARNSTLEAVLGFAPVAPLGQSVRAGSQRLLAQARTMLAAADAQGTPGGVTGSADARRTPLESEAPAVSGAPDHLAPSRLSRHCPPALRTPPSSKQGLDALTRRCIFLSISHPSLPPPVPAPAPRGAEFVADALSLLMACRATAFGQISAGEASAVVQAALAGLRGGAAARAAAGAGAPAASGPPPALPPLFEARAQTPCAVSVSPSLSVFVCFCLACCM